MRLKISCVDEWKEGSIPIFDQLKKVDDSEYSTLITSVCEKI